MNSELKLADTKTTEYITTPEVAKRMKLSTRTIEAMTKKGILPCIRFGRSVRDDWNAVVAALEEHTAA